MSSCTVRGCFSPGLMNRAVDKQGNTISKATHDASGAHLSIPKPYEYHDIVFEVDIEYICANGHAFIVVERIDEHQMRMDRERSYGFEALIDGIKRESRIVRDMFEIAMDKIEELDHE